MNRQDHVIDQASSDSFPASDPPSFTPTTGTLPQSIEERKVMTMGDHLVVHVVSGRGDEFRQHLAAHGLDAEVTTPDDGPLDRVDVTGNVSEDVLQDIVDQWEH